ncbi:hypothetical protein ACFE04_019291 [Oxalis oulophora]
MLKTSLPPGFCFHPTDVELLLYYLKRKVMGKNLYLDAIAEVDVYKYAPWDLPDKSCLKTKDLKWYFFCAREKKYANGARLKRATDCGFWKGTGKDRAVNYDGKAVGMIKTLVFHSGKPPKGTRTNWVMHEYRLEDKDLVDKGVVQIGLAVTVSTLLDAHQLCLRIVVALISLHFRDFDVKILINDAFVLSVVFQKDGIGPRNGAQYGAPFMEEEWSDNEEINCTKAVTFTGPVLLPHNQTGTPQPFESICDATPSGSCLSDPQIHPSPPCEPVNDYVRQNDDDIDLLLAQFTEKSSPADCETGRIENPGEASRQDGVKAPSSSFDPEAFFKDVGLPVNPGDPTFSEYQYPLEMFPQDDSLYLELLDLEFPTR